MSNYDPNYVPQKSYALIGQKAIILNQEKKLLILQRSEKSGAGGKWSLAGGSLETGEDPIAGIKREIVEETELAVSELKPYAVRSYMDKEDFVVAIGYVGYANGQVPKLNWEHDSYKWVTKAEALHFDLTPDGRYFIECFEKASDL